MFEDRNKIIQMQNQGSQAELNQMSIHESPQTIETFSTVGMTGSHADIVYRIKKIDELHKTFNKFLGDPLASVQ